MRWFTADSFTTDDTATDLTTCGVRVLTLLMVRCGVAIVTPQVERSKTVAVPRLWTTTELSEYTGIPIPTIYKWRLRGEGPRGVRVGKFLRFREDDVVAWLEELSAREEDRRPKVGR